jgi:hypothetical protein
VIESATAERPWIVIVSEHRMVTLEEGQTFFEWAHEPVAGAAVEHPPRFVASHDRVVFDRAWSSECSRVKH